MFLRWRKSSKLMHLKHHSWYSLAPKPRGGCFLLVLKYNSLQKDSLQGVFLIITFLLRWLCQWLSGQWANSVEVFLKGHFGRRGGKAILEHYCFSGAANILSAYFRIPYSSLVLQWLVFLTAVLEVAWDHHPGYNFHCQPVTKYLCPLLRLSPALKRP